MKQTLQFVARFGAGAGMWAGLSVDFQQAATRAISTTDPEVYRT